MFTLRHCNLLIYNKNDIACDLVVFGVSISEKDAEGRTTLFNVWRFTPAKPITQLRKRLMEAMKSKGLTWQTTRIITDPPPPTPPSAAEQPGEPPPDWDRSTNDKLLKRLLFLWSFGAINHKYFVCSNSPASFVYLAALSQRVLVSNSVLGCQNLSNHNTGLTRRKLPWNQAPFVVVVVGSSYIQP